MERQKHILVIDDNQDLLTMLNAMLTMKGYKVSMKENTDNIEAVVKELSPDIILMDMLLSGADGREICRQLKMNPELASIPLVMLSAHPQAREECIAAGADRFVEKPFDMKHLLTTLANISI